MTPERFRLMSELYDAAAAMDAAERTRFIDERCANDVELRRELLDAFRDADRTLDGIVEKAAAAAVGGGDPWTGRRLGQYQILRIVGEGGMGSVYQAEQDHPRRIVALKVIKAGLASADLLRRFERESQVLARLQHPGIAQIYEAGAAKTEFGQQPYFAMEFIHGVALREYAEAHKLGTRQRLELIAKVCDAVEHAHRRGVIHRDLKPANILVDEGGQPKILDFGVARATDSDAQATRQTDIGQLIGTLAYMSPEQVTADPLDLDTRSDVYALGVILYELLGNRLPYQLSQHLHEAVRTIREQDPTRLSSISRSYRGDVETIVAKALEKDKARRYSSAAELADDIRRYLDDQPIAARPASTSYQLRKFARRHKALVAATAVVFAVLIAGIVATTREALRARRAEQTAEAVNDFLQNDLLAQASAARQSGPRTKPDPDLKVRTALDRAAASVGGKFDRQPEVEAGIRATIGQAYHELGLYSEAQIQLQRAAELQRRVFGENNRATLRTLNRLGTTLTFSGKFPEAEALLSHVIEIQHRLLGPEDRETLGSAHNLALVYYFQGKYPKSEPLMLQTLESRRRLYGSEHPDTLASMNNLANLYSAQGKHTKAEALDRQTLEIRRRVMGPEHPETLTSINNLARDMANQGKFADAEAFYRQALEIQRRVLGPAHADTLRSAGNLAADLGEEGKYAESDALLSETLETQRRVLGAEHRSTLLTMANLAINYGAEHKYAEAETLLSQTLQITRRVLGPEHPLTLGLHGNLAYVYQQEAKYQLAASYVSQALAGRRRTLGSDNPDTMESATDLALAYISQGKFDAGEPLAHEAFEFGRKKQPDDWQTFRAESLLGASLAGQKKYTEAETLLLAGYRGMVDRKEQMSAVNWYHLDRAREWIVRLYQFWGKPDRAAEWRSRQ